MSKDKIIEGLNHALNREVSTFLRYILQSASIKGAEWDAVRNLYFMPNHPCKPHSIATRVF